MRDVFGSAKVGTGVLALVASLTALSACTAPVMIGPARSASAEIATVPPSSTGPSVDSAATIVEARQYWGSPTVSVVGWSEEDSGLGLRTWVRRGDGHAAPEHRLYVNWNHPELTGGINRAAAVAGPLEVQGPSVDPHNCSGNSGCSPYITLGVRIPDDLLRSVGDSLPVTLFGRDGREMHVNLRRELIVAYLGVVDSVSTSLKRRESALH